jgi:ubiquinol-cytochrome c reductase cytochrome c1 subunit
MIRFFAFLVGLGFCTALLIAMLLPREAAEPNLVHHFHQEPEKIAFASDGPLGRFDRQQLQRGFQVYKEVCSACHSMNLVAFRNLQDIGFTGPEVKAIANQWATEVPSINPDTGEPATRKATPADKFPSPYANEVAARAANNNALPPDLSLITKAREGGAPYVHSLLTGYRNPPADLPEALKPPKGLHYNPYFPNLNIAMPPPLVADGQVSYADGTKATVEQMSRDVAAFLVWTAEPKLENRKRTGVAVIGFLVIATILALMAYRNIWHGRAH